MLIHKKDEEAVLQLFEENQSEIKEQRKEKLKQRLLGIWRKVFKAVYLKKSY